MSPTAIAGRKLSGIRRRGERLLYSSLSSWREAPSRFEPTVVTDLEEYRAHSEGMHHVYASWQEQEIALIRGDDILTTHGYCAVCERWTVFASSWDFHVVRDGRSFPNWREHLTCPRCRLTSRMRAAFHLIGSIVTGMSSRIYIPEQNTPFFNRLRGRYSNIVGSEYLGERVPLGRRNEKGIRNEDITRLTFGDSEFDVILNFEVMEHVPDFLAGFAECARILRPGGRMLFSAPFDLSARRNLIRARVRSDGSIEHWLPPEYHGTPTGTERSLAFQVFGWELLDQLKQCGFSSVRAFLYWSREYCYLGGEQVIFLADKASC